MSSCSILNYDDDDDGDGDGDGIILRALVDMIPLSPILLPAGTQTNKGSSVPPFPSFKMMLMMVVVMVMVMMVRVMVMMMRIMLRAI